MRNDNEENTEKLIGLLAIRLILLAAGFLLLFIAAEKAFDLGKGIFYQKPVESTPGKDVQIEITDGDDAESLARILKENGVIESELAIVVQSRLYKIEAEPGSYTVNTSMTPKQILKSIAEQSEEIRESAKQNEQESVYGGGSDGG